MLKRLVLENFKSFKKLEIPELSNITLISGENNVGKTSLLEGIFLFYDQDNPGMFLRHLAWRGIDVVSADAEAIIAPVFRDFNLQHHMKIVIFDDIYRAEMKMIFDTDSTRKAINIALSEADETFPKMETNLTPQTSYQLKIEYMIDGTKKQNVHLIVKQHGRNNLNIQLDPGPVTWLPEIMRRGVIYLGLRMKGDVDDALRFSQLDIGKRSEQVIASLRLLEPNLEGLSSVSLPQQKPVMYADVGMKRKIPVAFLGEGMSRLLSIILAIATAKNGIVLIDEVDAGIHHSRMSKVWEGICAAAQTFNCQIIATTHSYECLQAAHTGVAQANMSRDFRYIRLDRHEQDIVAKTYTHEVLGAAFARGWEVR